MAYSLDRRVWPGALILAGITVLTAALQPWLTGLAALLLASHFLFFRDPKPRIPAGEAPVSPAEGKITEISYQTENRYLKEECVKIGIALSVFNAHVNRTPMQGTVDYLEYTPGKFMNALKQSSVSCNESNWIGLENGPKRTLVRQMAGALARRIFCDARIGTMLGRGEKFGVICYGSRVELFIPKKIFRPSVHIGDPVKAGQTILGEWL